MSSSGPLVSVWRERGTTFFEHECTNAHMVCHSLPEVIWGVECEKPLTIRIPINCGFCGLRGKWIAGEWVPMPPIPVAGRPSG